ncbi:hypothetical protein EXS45_01955 [Candidatus Nomurabacteria bacterium]|nr:hypothetical protein [Candidatus Nomurabacteria bacterium]
MDISNNLLGDSFFGSKWFNPDYLFNQAVLFFQYLFDFNVDNSAQILAVYNTFLFFLSLFFLTLISYCAVRMFEIRSKENKHLRHEIAEYAHHQAEREKKRQEGDGGSKNERWIKTLSYLFSQHASDWKLAVIEADTMLESLLDQLGFKGVSLGDKLKSSSSESFRGLSSAWEVHTIRNRIAHEGTSFKLSQHEAKRIIALYEQIFRQFGYI